MKTTRHGNSVTVWTWFDELNQKLHKWVAIAGLYQVRVYLFESPILQGTESRAQNNLRQIRKEQYGKEFARFIGQSI